MLPIIRYAVSAMWLAVVGYWLISARSAKPNAARRGYYALPLRLVMVVVIIIALRSPQVRLWLRQTHASLAHHVSVALVGALICAFGCALALAARAQLGRNWGMPMSQKVGAELVTTGPYAHVRHPIYGGLILAMLGSLLAVDLFWALPLLLFTPYFVVSARREERLMLSQFPSEYGEYRKRTKMLIPFVI